MKYLILSLLVSTMMIACTPRQSASPTESPVTVSEWKEGYGGDVIALETVHMIEDLCAASKDLRSGPLKRALGTSKDVAVEICDLLKPGALDIHSVEQPKVGSESKDFVNYPNQRPRRLEIKESFWREHVQNGNAESRRVVTELMDHEIMRMIGIPDSDYSKSRLLRAALDAAVSSASVDKPLCETDRIHAELAGASTRRATLMAVWYGSTACRPAYEIVREAIALDHFDAYFLAHLQQAFGFGVFVGLTQTSEKSPAGLELTKMMKQTLQSFPQVLDSWVWKDWAMNDTLQMVVMQKCDSLLCFIVSSGTETKQLAVGYGRPARNFSRAAAAFIRQIGESELQFKLLKEQGVNSKLFVDAIRTANWPQVRALGAIQAAVTPLSLPASIVLANTDTVQLEILAEIYRRDFDQKAEPICHATSFEHFVRGLINGDPTMKCGWE